MLDRLTPAEVYSLTKRKRHKAQMAVLRSQGIDFRLDGDGAPVVLRSTVEAILGAGKSSEKGPRLELDWSAVDGPA